MAKDLKLVSLKQKEQFWRKHIDRWSSSKVSQAEYCRHNDLSRYLRVVHDYVDFLFFKRLKSGAENTTKKHFDNSQPKWYTLKINHLVAKKICLSTKTYKEQNNGKEN